MSLPPPPYQDDHEQGTHQGEGNQARFIGEHAEGGVLVSSSIVPSAPIVPAMPQPWICECGKTIQDTKFTFCPFCSRKKRGSDVWTCECGNTIENPQFAFCPFCAKRKPRLDSYAPEGRSAVPIRVEPKPVEDHSRIFVVKPPIKQPNAVQQPKMHQEEKSSDDEVDCSSSCCLCCSLSTGVTLICFLNIGNYIISIFFSLGGLDSTIEIYASLGIGLAVFAIGLISVAWGSYTGIQIYCFGFAGLYIWTIVEAVLVTTNDVFRDLCSDLYVDEFDVDECVGSALRTFWFGAGANIILNLYFLYVSFVYRNSLGKQIVFVKQQEEALRAYNVVGDPDLNEGLLKQKQATRHKYGAADYNV